MLLFPGSQALKGLSDASLSQRIETRQQSHMHIRQWWRFLAVAALAHDIRELEMDDECEDGGSDTEVAGYASRICWL